MPNNKYNMICQKFGRLTVINELKERTKYGDKIYKCLCDCGNNVLLTYKGKTQSMAQWAKELNINYNTLSGRHYRGYTDKECLFGRDDHAN